MQVACVAVECGFAVDAVVVEFGDVVPVVGKHIIECMVCTARFRLDPWVPSGFQLDGKPMAQLCGVFPFDRVAADIVDLDPLAMHCPACRIECGEAYVPTGTGVQFWVGE